MAERLGVDFELETPACSRGTPRTDVHVTASGGPQVGDDSTTAMAPLMGYVSPESAIAGTRVSP
jgi:hypothetical protein